jgi:hypothetical protein
MFDRRKDLQVCFMSCLPETNVHRVMPRNFRTIEHELIVMHHV